MAGVRRVCLTPHEDERGCFTEFHRDAWLDGPRPVQWNWVQSRARCVRGIHVHVRHGDYLTLTSGHMELVVGDLRMGSPSFGQWLRLDLLPQPQELIYIPPGVAHGFHFPVDATHLYGVSEYWCPAEEMGCHWAAPDVSLPWTPPAQPIVSPRDAALGTLADLMQQLQPFQSGF